MSCKSAIYTVATNVDVAANGQIPFGSVIRRFGPNLSLSGFDIVACGQGYYGVDCSVTLEPVGAGPIGVQLYADGLPVSGAMAQAQGTAATPLNLSVTCLVRQKCQGATSLSMKLMSGDVTTGATIQNMATKVTKE